MNESTMDCYKKLKEMNYPPCPNDTGTSISPYCIDMLYQPPIHEYCMNAPSPGHFQYAEAYNATLCTKTEYDPVKCQEVVFETIGDLMNFLSVNPDFKSRGCYCCCFGYGGFGMPVATPAGMKAIDKVATNEEVMGAILKTKKGSVALSWKPFKVNFSQGTSQLKSHSHSTMIFIYCAGHTGLVVTEDQLVLTSKGTMKQANALRPGDLLVGAANGNPIPILHVRKGDWHGVVHHLALEGESNGDISGHLVNLNGFVAGDFSLQLNPKRLGTILEESPPIGSKEYDGLRNIKKIGKGFYSIQDIDKIASYLPKQFAVSSSLTASVPSYAYSFITTQQANSISVNPQAHFRPFKNKTAIDNVHSLFKQFKESYPDYHFYLDEEDIIPNAYAFEAYGLKQIVISGALLRLNDFGIEGQALVVAHSVACLLHGYQGDFPMPVTQADYYAIAVVQPAVWNFNAGNQAIMQMNRLWALISPKHDVGNPKDQQNDPPLDCRRDVMMYAQAGLELPTCAQLASSKLEATVNDVGLKTNKKSYVTLLFNQVVDIESAENMANYVVAPSAIISSVKANGKQVQVTGEFNSRTEYAVTISNVKSRKGVTLNPLKNTVKFTIQH